MRENFLTQFNDHNYRTMLPRMTGAGGSFSVIRSKPVPNSTRYVLMLLVIVGSSV